MQNLFFGIVFILIGAAGLICPDLVWMITESWKTDGAAEPSDLYRFSTRFGGAAFAIVGVAVIFL